MEIFSIYRRVQRPKTASHLPLDNSQPIVANTRTERKTAVFGLLEWIVIFSLLLNNFLRLWAGKRLTRMLSSLVPAHNVRNTLFPERVATGIPVALLLMEAPFMTDGQDCCAFPATSMTPVIKGAVYDTTPVRVGF